MTGFREKSSVGEAHCSTKESACQIESAVTGYNKLADAEVHIMKQVCLLCERTSPDNNLYCQETYCPAEMSPNILDYGEWLGDIEIVKPVMILRSAVLYEATHQNQKV